MEKNDNKKHSFVVTEEERKAAMELSENMYEFFSSYTKKNNGEINLGEFMDILSYGVIMFLETSRSYAPEDPGNLALSFASFNYSNVMSMTAEGRIGK